MSWQPGWYEDPWSPGGRRWWDGNRWTDHVSSAGESAAAGKRKWRVWPWVAGAAVLLLLMAGGAVALIVAISGDDTEVGRRAAPNSTPEKPTPPSEEPASNRLPPAELGETVSVRNQDGQRLRVTVTEVNDRVPKGTYFRGPKRGTRWVGVQVRFEGEGPGVVNDSVGNGIRVITPGGRYETDFSEPDACRPVPGGEINLSEGRTTQGCLIVPVPSSEKPQRVTFVASSGYGPDVGTWKLP